MRLRPKVALLPLLLLAGVANAHRLSPAFFGLNETEPAIYQAQWKVSISGGLVDALEPQIPDECTVVGGVRSYVVEDARLQHATLECSALEGLEFAVSGLPATDTDVLLRIDYLDGSSFTHRLVPDDPSVVIPERPGTWAVATTYLELGVEHILIGIDHLLFVLALLLLVRGTARLIVTVTAFTLAHSITLAAATLGIVNVPSGPVEATIALSILFLATELARRPSGTEAASLTRKFPWIVAFSFGLLHGFGFAGALSEVGLPELAIPLALLFFNIGVEIGQLLFIAAVLGLGWILGRLKIAVPAWSPRLTAYVIGSLAAFWVFDRTVTTI